MATTWTRRMVALAFAALIAGATPARAAEKVTFLTPTIPDAPGLVIYVLAKHLGYFAEEGLDVSFQRAQGGVDVAKQVGAGNADIGGALGDTSIIVRSNGIPVKTVAVLGGGSLMMIGSRSDAGIDKPADLKGKTITTLSYQDTTFFSLLGVLASAGLTRADVTVNGAGPQGIWQLVAQSQAQACACVAEWIAFLREAGVSVKLMPAQQYFPSMASAVIASDKAIKERPKVVRGVVRAVLKSMQFIIADPKAAAAQFAEAVPQFKGREAMLIDSFTLLRDQTLIGQTTPGAMDEVKLAKLQDFYAKEKVIEKASAPSDLFTNDFLK